MRLEEIQGLLPLELLAKQMVEGFITGLHKSPYHGFSVEFAEHKLYNEGESTRHIDWKVFARTDRLFTKRYEEETNLRCYMLLDFSGSMYYPEKNKGKIRFSIYAAAALAYLLQKQRDAFGIIGFDESISMQTEVKSSGLHLHKVFLTLEEMLDSEKKGTKTNVANSLHLIAEKIHKRSLVILFSDMFDGSQPIEELMAALQHLKHKKHEILLFHVTEPLTELHFDFTNRPHVFVDLESGQQIKLNPLGYKEAYLKHMENFYRELRLRCGQMKIDFIEADINEPFDKILNAYMIKRAKMY